MLIGPATAEDARAIAQIQVDAWRAAYVGIVPDEYLAAMSVDVRETMWREAIAAGQPELLVARRDDRVIGWVSFGASRAKGASPEAGEVWAIYLDPQHIATGTGRALWAATRARSTSMKGSGSRSTPDRHSDSRSAVARSKSCVTSRRFSGQRTKPPGALCCAHVPRDGLRPPLLLYFATTATRCPRP